MATELTIAAVVLAGAGTMVAAVQFLPPLTSAEAPLQRASTAGGTDVDEYGYCRANLPGVDCACFAQKAVQIMSQDNPQVSGWSYADQWDLAQTQASGSCR